MATVWIAGQDIEAVFGFYTSDVSQITDALLSLPQEVSIPGMAGTFFAGPALQGSRAFTLKGFCGAETAALVRTNVKNLKALVESGLLTVRVADWLDVTIEAKCIGFQVVPFAPQQISDTINLELSFLAPVPFWRDTNALPYRFDATPTPMPCGTASVAPELYGCATGGTGVTTPILKGYNHRGAEEWTATLATLLTGEAYKIVTAAGAMAFYKKAAGSALWVEDPSAKTAGVFPKGLASSAAAYRFAQWGLYSASAGDWYALYPRHWR